MTSLNLGATFFACDGHGEISDLNEHGLFAADTRFLSRWKLHAPGHAINRLSERRSHFSNGRWDLIIPQVAVAPNGIVSQIAISVERKIDERQMHEDIVVQHYGARTVNLKLHLEMAADFADIFEFRRHDWQERQIDTEWTGKTLSHCYQGPGSFFRAHYVTIDSAHNPEWDGIALIFNLSLPPGAEWSLCLSHELIIEAGQTLHRMACPRRPATFQTRSLPQSTVPRSSVHSWSKIRVENAEFQRAIDAAVHSLESLCLRTPEHHYYPAAGLPWFATLFGRDSIICAMQTMILGPEFAWGALEQLGRLQARSADRYRDAEPGKICHEMRVGEWAVTGKVPQNPYYGSADSTPLYLWLLAQLYRWHGNAAALLRFKPIAIRCLAWIDNFGDMDGDGFQEYGPREATGFPNQCWRDSEDGVPTEEGAIPAHPIATCEIQGYVYAAKKQMADLFEAWDDTETANRLRAEARELKSHFNDSFWVGERQFIALCLDGTKRPVSSISSDPGHCLWTEIVDEEKIEPAAEMLLSPELFTGYGIRTLESAHAVYDPHSYHRGSVWPHDSIIAAAGLQQSGELERAWRVIDGVISAASRFPESQMPEVFSGLSRQEAPDPVPYWRANIPQAWASGAIIHAVAVLCGLNADLPADKLHVTQALPEWCPAVQINGMRLGAAVFDLTIRRRGESVDVDVQTHSGTPPEIVIDARS